GMFVYALKSGTDGFDAFRQQASASKNRSEMFRRRDMMPNDKSSATRRTGRNDCNHDAPAGFAAAHGPSTHDMPRSSHHFLSSLGIVVPGLWGSNVRYNLPRRSVGNARRV